MHTAESDQLRTARVLVVVDQPMLAGVIQLALTHGPYLTRVASTISEANLAVQDWQPHLAVVDMDLVDGHSWNSSTRRNREPTGCRSLRSLGAATSPQN